ncbi:MAG: hypothetical protein PHH11_09555, partial [Methylomonas sp.]|nr:hypothetical protein [Methylomonas sp.]
MATKSNSISLDRFRFQQPEYESDTLITTCPKSPFAIHPHANRVLDDVMLVFHEGRWHLVDNDLYHRRIYVKGLL